MSKIPDFNQKEFNNNVIKRGGEILKNTKTSSVISACYAIKDHLRYWMLGLPSD